MIRIKKRTLVIWIIIAVLIGASISAGTIVLAKNLGKGLDKPDYKQLKSFYDKYSKLEELEKYVDESFYESVDEKKLKTGVAKGYIDGLGDPYSEYMTSAEYENWKTSTSGKYDGIGVTFSEDKNDNMVIISVNKNSPAERAGLRPGDYFLEVDGKTYTDSSAMAAVIRGKSGTKVKIKYYRNGKTKTVSIKREMIKNESVEYKVLKGNIGYIAISSFEEDTGNDFDKALGALDGKKVKGLIIDLRNNGGGLVESCIVVADDILPEGKIVSMKNKEGKEVYYESDKYYTEIPYVLLVNGETASASEIVSAAVKDFGTGKVIGTRTFGKGIVQSTKELSDGDALKLTVEQYFSPKGHKIHKKGIKPDIVIKNIKKTGKDEQLAAALKALKKQ